MTNKNIYISAHDVAEDARLNFEIEQELEKCKAQSSLSLPDLPLGSRWLRKPYLTWIPGSRSASGLRMTVDKWLGMTCLLATFAFLPTLAQAETCTPTPDCKSLGYTEASCPDNKGVKCPWNTSLWFCGEKCNKCTLKSCEIGDVLYSDKKCYTCPTNTLSGQVPIGVVFTTKKAVGLVDLSKGASWNNANTLCSDHKPGGISGWYLPSKDELLAMYKNRSRVVQGFSNAIGGTDFVSDYYWSSSYYGYYGSYGGDGYYIVNPRDGDKGNNSTDMSRPVRPVLTF